MANHSNPPPASREEAWRAAIDERLRRAWPNGLSIDAMGSAATARWIGHWVEGDCDLEHDVLPAITWRRPSRPTAPVAWPAAEPRASSM